MFQYANRRMSGFSQRRRGRRLAGRTYVADPAVLGQLVPSDDPPAVFTPAEDAEVAEGHSSQRTIEHSYNHSLSKRMRRLAKRAPTLERRKVRQLHQADHAYEVDQRLRRAEQANRDMRDHGRHMPRWARILIVLVLAAVDVVAYRAAVEVAFDTSDEWPAIIDSYLLSLLSIGMVMAAMFAAEQLKALHGASDRRVDDPDSLVDDLPRARRVWWQAGLPALAGSVVLLIAGAALRVNALGSVPGWFWLAVPAFSGAALVGAFFVEYKWADKALDERDDLARRSRFAQWRLHRADRRLASVEGDYRMREAEIEQLWSLYEPSWRVQMEMAAARIAVARSERPELFHPLGRSVVESVHERIARGTTRRDGPSALERLDLTVEQVLERAELTHAARRAPRPDGSLAVRPRRRGPEPAVVPPPAPLLRTSVATTPSPPAPSDVTAPVSRPSTTEVRRVPVPTRTVVSRAAHPSIARRNGHTPAPDPDAPSFL
ncbi:hypothetical protein [Desertimonas flava]|jgi:hypothetical protein|uniref:hypothetical protein n=1 Tax=Desertimonas flava TaxID=2064846 RepID=UPI000E34EEF3|nr:hypothetical protein [Desertimonas flava]